MNDWWTPMLEHDGLLLRDRALSDVEPDQLLVALRSGRLRRIQRSVYAPRSIALKPIAVARAAIISSAVPQAVASHATAARAHGLTVVGRSRVEHVTVPLERRKKKRPDLEFHTRSLQVGDVVVLDGVPVTSVARTVTDLACQLDRISAVWMVDDAIRTGVCSRVDLEAIASSWRGGLGSGVVKQRIREADGVSESVLETAARLTLADLDVPLPIAQLEVTDEQGRLVARLDGGYPHDRVALEFDGRSVHDAPAAAHRDRERQNRLAALGWTVLRFTWWDVVEDPKGFVSCVRAALVTGA
jgi:hypothetical protein